MLEVTVKGQVGRLEINAHLWSDQPVTAFYGRSGAGKSTLLRAISGLWRPDEGRIKVDDRVLFDNVIGIDVPVHKRNMGAVFQAALLFPTMSVERNLRYGFSSKDTGLFFDVVEMLDLGPLLNRSPRHLSGGEGQRVALGRALLAEPEILLLDEPLTGLDDHRRRQVIPYFAAIRDAMRVPIIYVSHDKSEIAALADVVFVVERGQVVQELSAEELTDFEMGLSTS
jgi:molybdate transport system ATP-binding protein